MQISKYQLKRKNPFLAEIVDTMQAGEISSPIFVNDEWYLVRLENVAKNIMINESDFIKSKKEVELALQKTKMDSLSDSYVDKIMRRENPIIRRDAFNILRSYMGKFILTREKYKEWNLDEKLKYALSKMGKNTGDEYSSIKLIEAQDTSYTLEDFIYWYRNRELYIKIGQTDLNDFSSSLEQLVWRMTRDKLLSHDAEELGYFDTEIVKTQNGWWKEKIASSAYRNVLTNSVLLKNEEISSSAENKEDLSGELNEKIFRELQRLKTEYSISIHKNYLNKINVTSEEAPKEIDLYSVKKGGLIPRLPYPTIDSEWENWQ